MDIATQKEKFENFIVAFSSGHGSCHQTCECGQDYINSNGGWDFEPNEVGEAIINGAIDLDHSVSFVEFGGKEYVVDCDCWHGKADMIIGFMDGHAHKIAKYLTLEKQRKQKEAKNSPIVEAVDEY